MAQHLRVTPHLSAEALAARFAESRDLVERKRIKVIHLATLGWKSEAISQAAGYGVPWVRKLVRRYNEGGLDALADGRHENPGKPRLLSAEQEQALDTMLRERVPPPDGGVWSGPKVARWMSAELKREVHEVRGWEVLRRLGYRHLVPRRRHRKANAEEQARFQAGAARSARS